MDTEPHTTFSTTHHRLHSPFLTCFICCGVFYFTGWVLLLFCLGEGSKSESHVYKAGQEVLIPLPPPLESCVTTPIAFHSQGYGSNLLLPGLSSLPLLGSLLSSQPHQSSAVSAPHSTPYSLPSPKCFSLLSACPAQPGDETSMFSFLGSLPKLSKPLSSPKSNHSYQKREKRRKKKLHQLW